MAAQKQRQLSEAEERRLERKEIEDNLQKRGLFTLGRMYEAYYNSKEKFVALASNPEAKEADVIAARRQMLAAWARLKIQIKRDLPRIVEEMTDSGYWGSKPDEKTRVAYKKAFSSGNVEIKDKVVYRPESEEEDNQVGQGRILLTARGPGGKVYGIELYSSAYMNHIDFRIVPR